MKARAVLSIACLAMGCSANDTPSEEIARTEQAISGAQALQFESTSPWSAGGTTLATSTTVKTQGSASLRVTTAADWHEIRANNLSSIGATGDKLGLDLRVDRQQPWGELRAVVSIPSQQVWDVDLGGASLVGRPTNQFFRVEFNLPATLKEKLAATYSDLEIRFRINAFAAVYHFDNGTLAPPAGMASSINIGNVTQPGSTTLNGGVYTIQGSGSDIWHTADDFRFLYQSLSGDGQIVARIADVSPTHEWTKIGVMVRDSLASNAKNAFMLLRPSQGSAFQYRSSNGGGTFSSWQDAPGLGTQEHDVRYLRPAKWLKLTRQGNVFTAYSSDDGQCWWQRWTQTFAFDDSQAFFGVALSPGAHQALATAQVSNFAVTGSVEPHNAQCQRALLDGDLPVPASSSWVVRPARHGGSTWHFTTTNPNGVVPPFKCNTWAEDVPPGTPDREPEIAARSDGPDHPNCVSGTAGPTWTQLGFSPGASWQLNRPLGIGISAARPGDVLSTFVDARGIWLRKTFSLSTQAQKNGLMLWGRWHNGISVYVNGVLATSNNSGTEEYKYLGLSNQARAALVVGGNNVVAVRLEWDDYYWNELNQVTQTTTGDRFFDMGLAVEPRLASLPADRMTESSPAFAAYVDTFKEFMQQQGMSGATFAVRKGNTMIASAGLGWHNKNLNAPMPRHARLRLASNDKIFTQAAIVKLIEDGRITPDTPVFPLLGLEPIPGYSPGANVDLITVEHLRTHTSGIAGTVHGQTAVDEMAFRFGISPDQWTSEHNARWLYSLDATDVGGAGRYSSNGYFLLRYLIEHLIAPQTLAEYLDEDMDLENVVIGYERLAGRQPNEGYVTREPSWDRWMALENYLTINASAEGYTKFFDDFELGYNREANDGYSPSGGGVMGGAMRGTWSIAIQDRTRAYSLVMISNNHGNFDEVIPRLDKLTYESSPCLFGAEDPRTLPERLHFIHNIGQPDRYINNENGLAASPALAGQWSSQWQLEAVDATYVRIKNRWTEEYLHMEGGVLGLSTSVNPASTRVHWRLIPTGSVFNIQNRGASRYLRVDGTLTTGKSSSGTNAQWNFCN